MRRRTLLRASAGLLSLPSLAAAGSSRRSEPYEPYGRVDIEGAREAAVGRDGGVAYVATGDGFVSVDVSDPRKPSVLAQRRDIEADGGTFRNAWDLWPSGDRLAVAGPAHRDTGSATGFALFDVSDPAAPEQVAFHPTGFHIHNSYFADGVVYLAGSGLPDQPVVMVDVTADEPEEVGRWSLLEADEAWGDVPVRLRSLHDLSVRDGTAYLLYWDAGTWLVDVSNPADPAALSRVGGHSLGELRDLSPAAATREATVPPGNHHYGEVDDGGTVLAVGRESWAVEDGAGGPGGVTLYDVTNEQAPERFATVPPPESFDQSRGGWFTTAHNCDIVGDRLYTSWYFGGVKVHDVSDPADPRELAWWRDPTEAAFWTAQSADGSVVAASVDGSTVGTAREAGLQSTRDALYTFPDRAGTQPDPPDLTAPPGEDSTSDPTPEPTPEPTPGTTPTPDGAAGDGTATPGGTPPGADVVPSSDLASVGTAALLGGLGLGTWLHYRGARDRDPGARREE